MWNTKYFYTYYEVLELRSTNNLNVIRKIGLKTSEKTMMYKFIFTFFSSFVSFLRIFPPSETWIPKMSKITKKKKYINYITNDNIKPKSLKH